MSITKKCQVCNGMFEISYDMQYYTCNICLSAKSLQKTAENQANLASEQRQLASNHHKQLIEEQRAYQEKLLVEQRFQTQLIEMKNEEDNFRREQNDELQEELRDELKKKNAREGRRLGVQSIVEVQKLLDEKEYKKAYVLSHERREEIYDLGMTNIFDSDYLIRDSLEFLGYAAAKKMGMHEKFEEVINNFTKDTPTDYPHPFINDFAAMYKSKDFTFYEVLEKNDVFEPLMPFLIKAKNKIEYEHTPEGKREIALKAEILAIEKANERLKLEVEARIKHEVEVKNKHLNDLIELERNKITTEARKLEDNAKKAQVIIDAEANKKSSFKLLLIGFIFVLLAIIGYSSFQNKLRPESSTTTEMQHKTSIDMSAQQTNNQPTIQPPPAAIEVSKPLELSATAATVDTTENACVTEKQALFQQRRSKQIERYKKEAQQRGEAFNMPSADSVTLVMAEVAKAAASSCIAESEAQLNGRPSFDCAKAFHDDEKLICGSRNLAALDVKLSNAYKAALFFSVDKEAFKAQSRNWIETRRQCKDAPCVERLYTEQQAHLKLQLE